MQSADFLSAVFFYLKVGENLNQNWIVENLNNAFSTWNGKLGELWGLVTTGPQTFKGGAVWSVMQTLHNGMVGIGYALVVLFFAISLCKNTMNFHELKRPEAAIHYFLRFVAAKALVGYGMDIMLNVFSICNGIVTDMADSMGGISEAMVSLPTEMQKHIEIEDFYAKCMTISEYPQQLDDKFISALLQQVPYIVLSIDIEPVETEDAFKEIDNAQMKTDAEKVRFNKKSVENLDFTSSVPQRTQEQDRIIANIRKEMTENDQQMFLSLHTVTCFADTLEDLALETDALKTTAANYNCRFTELYFQQERAFNTAMPYGLRRIESVRTMLTKSLTALVPFNTQEILTPGGICYGRNAVTGNLIIGLRTSLVNGNAMVVATSGGGKSMFVKLEILMLYLRFTKARFYVVDPENEYAPLVQELGGEVVNISVDSATHFNPLDFKYDKATKIPPHVAKAEFVLSLCEQIMGKEHILAGDKSLIDDALENIYKPLMESHYTAPCPTIRDLWMALNNQRDKRSKEIALALRIFATGSMQAFAQPTNVDMSNRLICFNIQSLGEQLKPVAMLSMLEYINTAVMSNERNDPKAATWVYFDEIYLLLRDSLSANFLYTSWKRFRKYNASATGITQNVQDCLTNDTAYAMLANSEFVVMLRQTKDIDSVVELYGLSEPQRKYLLLAQPGEGIIKMGNSLIPFNNPQPKDTKTYKLLTTKPGEMEG